MMNSRRRSRIADGDVKIGFETNTIVLTLDQMVQLKIVTPAIKTTRKYLQILASVREVGIIEPVVVTKDPSLKGKYTLLDGHLRIEALKDLGVNEAICLLSTDDESFTYNRYINRLSPIQEHRMIVKSISLGVSEAKIAQALGLDESNIIRKRNMLMGICPEAIEILKDKMVAHGTFEILKKMKPMRQIEVAILMHDANLYSIAYASALLAGTSKDKMLKPEVPKKIKGLDANQMIRMESEMSTIESEYKLIEEDYGTDVLNLTLAKSYLTSLLDNSRIVKYLAQHHAEILSQFQKITDMKSLNETEPT